jgi:hypothetical protein
MALWIRNPGPLVLLLGFFFSAVVLAATQETNVSTSPLFQALPSMAGLKECLKQDARSAECLDELYREALQLHSTGEALQLIQRFEKEDAELRRDCHPIVHAIGRETFRLKRNIHDSFAACDQTCHSGCYHGAVERFLRGDSVYAQTDKHPSQAELQQKAAVACDPNAPLRIRYQCLHGLGHALLYFSRYRLPDALKTCDTLPDSWSQSSCYGGVFMENVSNATPEKRDLSPSDVHYPCSRVDPKYRGECYLMQTSRMTEMGLSTKQLFEECEKAAEHRIPCMQSVGRDLSNDVRLGRTRAIAQQCELLGPENRVACVRGVIYALVDNTWDGRYALPFCAAFAGYSDHESCVRESLEYLKIYFDKTIEDLISDCARHLGEPGRCLELSVR